MLSPWGFNSPRNWASPPSPLNVEGTWQRGSLVPPDRRSDVESRGRFVIRITSFSVWRARLSLLVVVYPPSRSCQNRFCSGPRPAAAAAAAARWIRELASLNREVLACSFLYQPRHLYMYTYVIFTSYSCVRCSTLVNNAQLKSYFSSSWAKARMEFRLSFLLPYFLPPMRNNTDSRAQLPVRAHHTSCVDVLHYVVLSRVEKNRHRGAWIYTIYVYGECFVLAAKKRNFFSSFSYLLSKSQL